MQVTFLRVTFKVLHAAKPGPWAFWKQICRACPCQARGRGAVPWPGKIEPGRSGAGWWWPALSALRFRHSATLSCSWTWPRCPAMLPGAVPPCEPARKGPCFPLAFRAPAQKCRCRPFVPSSSNNNYFFLYAFTFQKRNPVSRRNGSNAGMNVRQLKKIQELCSPWCYVLQLKHWRI